MHVRFSTALGLPVCEEGSHEPLGHLDFVLLDPDTGKIEGFFVKMPGMFFADQKFLPAMDILRWSLRIVVSSADVLCDPRDIIRIESLMSTPRPILSQRMITTTGQVLGRCTDIQFDTTHFLLEWLFPKKWFRNGVPVPASQISEVRTDAVVIQDLKAGAQEKVSEKPSMLPPVVEPEAA